MKESRNRDKERKIQRKGSKFWMKGVHFWKGCGWLKKRSSEIFENRRGFFRNFIDNVVWKYFFLKFLPPQYLWQVYAGVRKMRNMFSSNRSQFATPKVKNRIDIYIIAFKRKLTDDWHGCLSVVWKSVSESDNDGRFELRRSSQNIFFTDFEPP